MNHRIASVVLFVALALVGCSGTNPQTTAGDGATTTSLVGPTWRLVAFGEAARGAPPVNEDVEITVAFDAEEKRVAGSAGCNRYFGSYEASDDGRLVLSQMGATKRACVPSVMEREQAYLGGLDNVSDWERAGDRLTLLDSDGEHLLHFTARRTSGVSEKAGAMPPQRTGKTYVYDCPVPGGEHFSVTTRTGPGELAVWLPERFAEEGGQERYLVLPQVRSADGAKYQDGPVTAWTKGLGLALLEVDGQMFTDCTRNRERGPWVEAKRRGADFRAVGQEPGWHLEICEGERIRFVYDYGEHEAVVPAPEPTVDEAEATRTYRAETEAHDLTAILTDELCTDAMSGERFPTTVTVVLNDETYRGCGRRLH
jgi:heat shock protein HslJ/uncharacterized membrane protein